MGQNPSTPWLQAKTPGAARWNVFSVGKHPMRVIPTSAHLVCGKTRREPAVDYKTRKDNGLRQSLCEFDEKEPFCSHCGVRKVQRRAISVYIEGSSNYHEEPLMGKGTEQCSSRRIRPSVRLLFLPWSAWPAFHMALPLPST